MADSDGSDMSSDTSSAGLSTSRSSSEASDSPRDEGGSGGAGAAPPPPSRRVPPLSLLANLAALPRGEGDCDAPATARQGAAAPPGPAMAGMQHSSGPSVPRLLLPTISAEGTVVQPHPQVQLQPDVQTAAQAQLSLDILSPAFSVDQQQHQGGADHAGKLMTDYCVNRLGMPLEQLKFYALVEVKGLQHLPPGCTRAAVEVVDSRFSLAALEELVAENQRLTAATQRQQQQADGQPAAAADAQQLEVRLAAVQLEKEKLRKELELSELLRKKAANALRELHQEFNFLSQELIQGSALSKARKQQLVKGVALANMQKQQQQQQEMECNGDAPSTVGTPVAVLDGLLQDGSCDG